MRWGSLAHIATHEPLQSLSGFIYFFIAECRHDPPAFISQTPIRKTKMQEDAFDRPAPCPRNPVQPCARNEDDRENSENEQNAGQSLRPWQESAHPRFEIRREPTDESHGVVRPRRAADGEVEHDGHGECQEGFHRRM